MCLWSSGAALATFSSLMAHLSLLLESSYMVARCRGWEHRLWNQIAGFKTSSVNDWLCDPWQGIQAL